MNPNVNLLEMLQVVPAFMPASLTTARTGDVVSLKNYRRCLVLFVKGIGTAGQDPTITLEQATNVAAGGAKALNFTTVYVKQDPTSIGDVGQWTKVTQNAANTYTDATAAEQEVVWAIDVKAEDLDIANDFDCIRASIGDVGTASQLGTVLYLLYDPVQMTKPESMPSAIIN